MLTLIIFNGCGGEEKVDPINKKQWEVFNFIPKESQLVIYMNLNELKKNNFWDKYLEPYFDQTETKAWLGDFEEQTGIGINKGVAEVITSTSRGRNNLVAFIFDQNVNKIHLYLNDKKKFSSELISGKKIFSLKDNNKSKIFFINDSTLILLSSDVKLKDILEGKYATINSNKDFIDIIQKIKNKKHFWFAINDGSTARYLFNKFVGNFNELPGNKLIRAIKKVTFSAKFGEGIELETNLFCNNTKNAYLISVGISSVLAMDIISERNYLLGQLTKNLEVSRIGSLINLELKLTQKDMHKLDQLNKNTASRTY
ncbi:MAG: hypothetical protein ABI550_00210 [Ignavibacteriaceae bacterium]